MIGVSCQISGWILELLEHQQISPERWIRNLPVRLEQLRDPSKRIDWDVFATLCERLGADVNAVRNGIGLDTRIGTSFLFPGIGYGGSCFPKDVKALIRSGHDKGMKFDLLQSVEDVNARQKKVLFNKLYHTLGDSLKGATVGVWGLAFKAETDDVRESPSIPLVESLLEIGATVRAHDPKATETARALFGDRIYYASDPYDAVQDAEALVVVTEWLIYRNPDFHRIKSAMRRPLIIDGRNLYEPSRMHELGIHHHGIGRRAP